jgi:TRAP transporter TAXI family solute receptor
MKSSVKRLAAALALTVGMSLVASPAFAADKKQYVFGAGSPGGTWEMISTGITKVLNQYASFELLPTTFTTINAAPAAINDGEVVLSICSLDICERGYKGVDNFKGHPSPNIYVVMAIYDNVMGYLVRGDSKIKAIEDVNEDTVFATTPGNVVAVSNHLRELHKAGFMKADPEVILKKLRRMTYAQAWDQLGNGNVEVVYGTGFPYNGGADSVISTKGARFVNVSQDPNKVQEFRKIFGKVNPDQSMLAVPKGTYSNTTEDVWGPTSFTVIYAGKDTSNEVVAEFIDLTIKHMDEIAKVHPAASMISLEANKRNFDLGIMQADRMHPGAIEYFKKVGILK